MGIDCTYTEMSLETSFVNPYNFVDIDYSVKATDDINKIKGEERFTGVMHCIMTAKTPIAIPDTEEKQPDNAHKEYKFMTYPNGKHFIPASSIRGTIRSVFETATDSCFSTTRDNTKLDERLSATRGSEVKAGVLVKQDGTWKLYAATRYMLRASGKPNKNRSNPKAWDDKCCPAYVPIDDKKGRYIFIDGKKYYDGDKVCFDRLTKKNGEDIKYQSKRGISCAPIASKVYDPAAKCSGQDEGYLVIGEPIRGKHHSSIFKVDINTTKPEPYSNDVIERAFEGLKRTVALYNDKSVNNNLKARKDTSPHYGYPAFEGLEEKGGIPIWYLEEKIEKKTKRKTGEKRLYFMMANIGRRAFYKTLNEHLREKDKCTDRKHLCPACRLFGIANSTGSSVGSRIRFTDAVCMTEELIDKQKTMLAELGKPRTSYMPFYSRGSKSYYDKHLVPGYDSNDVTIRGRKFYWHSENFDKINKDPDNPVLKTDRNASMQLAKAGAAFEFDIYFDGILEKELRQLVWSVNFFENDKDGKMCHKIGHGKPIGLGSVKISIDHISRRLIDKNGYHIVPYNINYTHEPILSTASYVKQLKFIVDFSHCQDVSYPYVVPENDALKQKVKAVGDSNALANHHWFTENKSGGLYGHDHEVQFLPRIPESNNNQKQQTQELFVYIAEEKKSDTVWIAAYPLDNVQRKSLVGSERVQVDMVKEWACEDNIRSNVDKRKTILLPSNTKKKLIDLAMQLYDHVYVATKSGNSKYDDGWKQMK